LGLDGPFLQDLNSEDSKKDIIIDGQKNVLIRKIEKLTLSEEFKIALIRILEGESYNPMLEDEIKAQKAEKLKKQEESRKNLMQGIKAIDWKFFVSYAPAFLAANFINQNNLFFIPQFLHSFLKSIPTYISLPEEPVTTVLVLLTLAYLVDNLPFVSLIRKGIHKALPAKKDK